MMHGVENRQAGNALGVSHRRCPRDAAAEVVTDDEGVALRPKASMMAITSSTMRGTA